MSEPVHAQRGERWPISIAPMAGRTDRHFRFFARQLTRRALLYTEMIHCGAVLGKNRERVLAYSAVERPLALQLAGDDPVALAQAAQIAAARGFEEINLNVGCPSPRVQKGRFGACLMAQPQLVARCVEKMRQAVTLPVTVKHRLGIDQLDRYEDLVRFVARVAQAGCDRFVVHARVARLGNVTPKQNRRIPPLRYHDVYRLKEQFPTLRIEINGGITTLEQAVEQLAYTDGVMIGRAAYDNLYLLAEVDQRFYGQPGILPNRHEIAQRMLPYLREWSERGQALQGMTRHLMGLFAGQAGARAWRYALSQGVRREGIAAVAKVLEKLGGGDDADLA